MVAPNESPELDDLASVAEREERGGPRGGGGEGGSVQATALRGHCLAYCQRDRADFICSVRSSLNWTRGLESVCCIHTWYLL